MCIFVNLLITNRKDEIHFGVRMSTKIMKSSALGQTIDANDHEWNDEDFLKNQKIYIITLTLT